MTVTDGLPIEETAEKRSFAAPPRLKYNLHMKLPDFMLSYFSEDALGRIKLSPYQWRGKTLARLAHDFRGYPRGTVFHEGGIVYGYPKIMRILHLERGIHRYFPEGGFYVEEKIDGYNVRVCLIDGEPAAFTRGGFVCPFSTERIKDLIDLSFFSRHPNDILCGEMAGPENPYNAEEIAYIKKDVKFFAFDIGRARPPAPDTLSPAEKYSLLDREGLPQVRRWGPFKPDDIKNIKALILDLDADGREGIVIKPQGPPSPVTPTGGLAPGPLKREFRGSSNRALKYVTLSSCLRDLEATAPLIAELPAGFFIQRLMRAAFFCHEFGLTLPDDYLLDSARALYLSNINLLKEIEGGGTVREFFKAIVKETATAEALIDHLKQTGVKVSLTSLEKSDGQFRAVFKRTYRKGSRQLRRMLGGHGFYD